jgi:hypothetical protein
MGNVAGVVHTSEFQNNLMLLTPGFNTICYCCLQTETGGLHIGVGQRISYDACILGFLF